MPGEIFTLPPVGVQTRWASPENPRALGGHGGRANGGRKGAPNVPLRAGESLTLAHEPSGSGTIRRIWMTVSDRSPAVLRGVRVDFFWDGADQPAVSAPMGDFFGIGLGRAAPFENVFFSNTEGKGFNTCLPMPFRDGMRLVITNETDRDIAMLFYDVDYTIGDTHGPDTLYLHAHFRRENPTTLQRDYEILPAVSGRGRFLGANIGVIPNRGDYLRTWWGEGEVKIYLDGDTDFPTLCGTGAEDYVGAAWGLGAFAHRYQGCPLADDEESLYCFYRYHVPDPIYFREGIRVAVQQIGHAGGEGLRRLQDDAKPIVVAGPGRVAVDYSRASASGILFERQDDWSSCAYFYLDRPNNDLPPLAPWAERVAGL